MKPIIAKLNIHFGTYFLSIPVHGCFIRAINALQYGFNIPSQGTMKGKLPIKTLYRNLPSRHEERYASKTNIID